MHRQYAFACGTLIVLAWGAAAVRGAVPTFKYFFTAANNSYKAYLDTANESADRQGYRLVTVRIDAISPSFRAWIEKNYPGGEPADYAVDSYSIDCAGRKVGEHRIVFYDSDGFPLTDYDLGGHMAPPAAGSMKDYLMREVCGF